MQTAGHSLCRVYNPVLFPQANGFYSGLGVGSTPSAFINHGIETTIVEIDPVVHQFATQFFHLPANHIAAIEDATEFVKRSQDSPKYDYIVHDVFTGGAEPAELFTVEFLSGLQSLLKPDGVIAIVGHPLTSKPFLPLLTTSRTMQATSPFSQPGSSSEQSDPSSPPAGSSGRMPNLPTTTTSST